MRAPLTLTLRKRWHLPLLIVVLALSLVTSRILLSALAPHTALTNTPAALNDVIPGGGGHNVVNVVNQTPGMFMARGNVQLNRIPAPTVAPANLANAQSTNCTGCKTFAVALQINLYKPGSFNVSPQNAAVAVNSGCNGCVTVAKAYQYTIPVDDPTQVPPDVQQLTNAMDQELNNIQQLAIQGQLNVPDAEARVDAVIAQFQQLAQYLMTQRDEKSQ